MAYTLKTTGIATKLIACIAVDEDGTTVKDFVSGNTGTHHASIAAPKTGVATWKGTNRNWFKTDYGATWYDAQGFLWSPVEALSNTNGHSFFCAANSFDDTGESWLWSTQSGNHGLRMTATNQMGVLTSGGLRGTSTTAAPQATKLSIGVNIKNNGTSLPFYYGLESGSLAADGTYTVGDVVNAENLILFGGLTGQPSFYGKYFIACWFSDATLLTEAEFQSLHNDWFGTLFEAAITGTFAATTGATTMAASGAHITPITGTFAATTGAMTMAASGTVNVPPKQLIFSSGAGNLIKDASQNLVTASTVSFAWYDSTTVTALGTVKDVGTFNISAGVASITLSNTSLVAGQTGTLMIKWTGLVNAVTKTYKQYIEMTIT